MKKIKTWLTRQKPMHRFLFFFLFMQITYVLTVYLLETLWDEPEPWPKLLLSNLPVTLLLAYFFSKSFNTKK